MKRHLTLIGIIGLIACFSVLLMMGCAKKAVVKEEAPSIQGTTQATEQTAEEKAKEEAALKEKTLREAAEREAAARALAEKERNMREQAARAGKEKELVDIHFDFDKYDLKPEAREILKGHAAWLTKKAGYTLVIEGNCDERGTTEYNLALGERRANVAMKYLVDLGVDPKIIKTISYGKEKPLDPGQNEEAWAKNRRDHFVVTPQK